VVLLFHAAISAEIPVTGFKEPKVGFSPSPNVFFRLRMFLPRAT
jgi:hypothetical protein